MIKSTTKNFTTLNDVLSFIKTEPDWGPNYNNIIVAALKARRKSDALKIKSTLSVGSTVGVAGRFEYWLGTVTKVMKTRCAVTKMNDGRSYSVPMSMIDVKEAA
tara:strand:- start:45 stop:356 length:312 start_codon:yes stop_codon:yes gene_type:complete